MTSAHSTLVDSYADALFQAALKTGVLESLAGHVKEVLTLVGQQPKLRTFMEAPSIPRETKEELVVKVFEGRMEPLFVNFVRMLIRRGRLYLYRPALDAFLALYDKHRGVTRATVTTAKSLGDQEKAQLEKALADFLALNLTIDYKVDDALIGGVRFLCGDLLIDSALSARLARLQHNLLNTKVY